MAFQLITPQHLREINSLLEKIPSTNISEISTHLSSIIEQVRTDIPEKRRISTGRYSIVKTLGETLFPLVEEPFDFGAALFKTPGDPFVRSLGLQLLSLWAVENQGLEQVKTCFEAGAAEESDWIVRECASGLVRKLTKTFPDEVRSWYLALVQSPDPNLRRFVSESLRPVVENRWFHKEPDYALGIISHLFRESAPYPRTSVGNNLSDWLRVAPDKAWPIVEELAENGDNNSYWIAYRSCRNYVKKEPVKVMRLLGVTEYKYKKQCYNLADYH
jgi:3-methyladenine DNA glycosylase AlkC